MKSSLAGLFAIGLMAGAVSSQAQSYNITDLGALPGDTISFPAGLNSSGQAAGTSANATSGIATLYSDGNVISLGTLGASDLSFAQAINGSGQVVGYDWLSSAGVAHAFLYSNGRMMDIHCGVPLPERLHRTRDQQFRSSRWLRLDQRRGRSCVPVWWRANG